MKSKEALEDLYYVILIGYPKDMTGKTIQTKRLLDFIKHAEKQEELLNKIREIIDRPFETPFPSMLEEAERYVEIYKLLRSY